MAPKSDFVSDTASDDPRRHRIPASLLRWSVITAFVMAFLLSGVAAPRVHAQTFTTLHSFQGTDGSAPYYGSLVVDSQGNLFGTTELGGSGGYGTVFELVKANNYAETVLHNFSSSNSDGELPYAGLIIDPQGNLYGTTELGGTSGDGTVFELTAASNYVTENVLYSFSYTDGALPYAGLIMDSNGNLFGTTSSGGSSGGGNVFELTAASSYATENVLYSFSGTGDGYEPYGGLAMDSNGNLYGTTLYGGLGYGNVFELDASNNYAETVLHNFSYGDGSNPYGNLVLDSNNNLYGTTEIGGNGGYGVVYELVAANNYAETVLHSFAGDSGGSEPLAGVVRDSSGNLYGTTAYGGSSQGDGVVFKLDASNSYAESLLHTFSGSDGAYPYAGLTMDQTGNFYGTTYYGGSYVSYGTVFSIATNSTVQFASMAAKVNITAGPPPGFNLKAQFTLGGGSPGIDPLNDPLTLQVGTYSVSVPPGSFSAGPFGTYVFSGAVNNATFNMRISPQATNQYLLQVSATGVDLSGVSLPTTVTLTIGNNTGSTQTTTGPLSSVSAPQHQK